MARTARAPPQISCDGSSRQSKHKEGSLCRTCALIATDTRLKTTFGGSHLGTNRISAIGGVCGVWRPVRLEESEQSLGHTRLH